MLKGHFISVWEEGHVVTPCFLAEDSGELFPEAVDVGDLGSLEKEFFQTPDGNEIPVCPTCHEFILKNVMNPGVGHTLNEEDECSNPECESHNK